MRMTKSSSVAEAKPLSDDHVDRQLWVPSIETAFSLLLIPRMISALVNPIADCDETYNYWEPLHYLLYRFGFQTWEYSPIYALRSYVYLLLHYIIVKLLAFGSIYGLVADEKFVLFYGLRATFGLLSAYAEAHFYNSTIQCFNRRTARYLLYVLVLNAGIFHASTAFLPSSFTMMLVLLFTSAWMDRKHYQAMVLGILAVLCGWPYVAVLFLPFAVDTLYTRGLVPSILVGAAIGGAVAAMELCVNYYYYHKWVLPAWNLVVYNVLSSETDSTLYGTEPLRYYLFNLVLQFNVVALLAVPAMLLIVVLPTSNETSKLKLVAYISPMYVWVAILFVQPHKEERFLAPVYPLFCLAAAITLSAMATSSSQFIARFGGGINVSKTVITCLLGLYAVLSLSRVVSNVVNYSAPLRVYQHLSTNVLPQRETSRDLQKTHPIHLCLLKEWHRFPTSFFLPSNATQVAFVKTLFSGQLPKAFESHENGTWTIPRAMNHQNQEEMSRYVPLAMCDYVVDLNLPNQKEIKLWDEPNTWELVHSELFLDAARSKSPYRSFYIPLITPRYVTYAEYAVYKRKKT